jgi:hypothetical protein
MKHTTYVCLPVIIACCLAFCAGCGDGRPRRVPVSGTVLIDGQPLAHGSIQFISDSTRPAGGSLDSEGRFVLSCYEVGDGAITGKYQVAVAGKEYISETRSRWHAPKKYASPRTSGLEVEISEPTDDLKIELTWDGGQPFVE